MNPGNELILTAAALVAITVILVNLLRLIQSVVTNRTLRKAIDKDPAQAERMLAALAQRDSSGDGRTAAVLIAAGIALFAASIIASEGWMKYGIGASLFPLLIGVALLLREVIVRRAQRAGS